MFNYAPSAQVPKFDQGGLRTTLSKELHAIKRRSAFETTTLFLARQKYGYKYSIHLHFLLHDDHQLHYLHIQFIVSVHLFPLLSSLSLNISARMRSFIKLAATLSACIAGCCLASPVSGNPDQSGVIVQPGDATSLIITKSNTINDTTGTAPERLAAAVSASLPLALVNFIRAGPVTAYVTGKDSSGHPVILQNNGQFFYPTAQQGNPTPQQVTADIGIPLGAYGSTKNVVIPNFINSGRVWFAVGQLKFYSVWPSGATGPSLVEPAATNPQDPSAGVKWGFIELTTDSETGIYANLSFVDFVGLVLGISLKTTDGRTLSAKGLKPGSLNPICDAMKAAGAKDGQPWGNLCMVDGSGNTLRVLSPQKYLSLNTPRFSAYWTNYVNSVMARYSKEPLFIDTPPEVAGRVSCTASGQTITCAGDNYGYGVPTALDIYGCASGPFTVHPDENAVHKAVRPILCAAYNRATLLLGGGNIQPSLQSSSYYLSEPANLYSKTVHQLAVDGRGYAFPFDDVTPPGGLDQSGSLVAPNPQQLTVYVGGQQ